MAIPIVSILDVSDYDAQIKRCADVISGGGVAIVPTETVYGAAARLDRPQAISRLRELRPGPDRKPFTIHLAYPDEAFRYVGPVSDLGRRMIKKLWPGPVGLLFQVPPERRQEVAGQLGVSESELYDGGSITLRCPDHTVRARCDCRRAGPRGGDRRRDGGWSRGAPRRRHRRRTRR